MIIVGTVEVKPTVFEVKVIVLGGVEGSTI